MFIIKNCDDLEEIWKLMLKYQEDNNIINHCVENSVFWNDIYDQFGFTEKLTIKVGTLLSKRKVDCVLGDEDIAVIAHCYLEYDDGTIVEPSFEFKNIKREYVDLKDLRKRVAKASLEFDIRQHISNIHMLQQSVNEFTENYHVSSEYYKNLEIYIQQNIQR